MSEREIETLFADPAERAAEIERRRDAIVRAAVAVAHATTGDERAAADVALGEAVDAYHAAGGQ